MDKQTNMHAYVTPMMEFSIPESEVDKQVKVGDVGAVTVPVVIVSHENGMVTFRKTKNLEIQGGFRAETTGELRKRIIEEQEEAAEPLKAEKTEDETEE